MKILRTTASHHLAVIRPSFPLLPMTKHVVPVPLSCFLADCTAGLQVLAKFLAPPGRLADLLSIAGDSSDGIVGANGYGPVKAAKV